jgi:hypothetical protein
MLTQRLPIRKLNLNRVDQYITRERLAPRSVSTMGKGTIALDGGPARPLAPGQMLEAASTLGPVSISLKDDRLGIHYEGEVRGLSLGFDGARQDLMPTVLRWMLVTHLNSVLVGLMLYLVFLTFLALRLAWKRG